MTLINIGEQDGLHVVQTQNYFRTNDRVWLGEKQGV